MRTVLGLVTIAACGGSSATLDGGDGDAVEAVDAMTCTRTPPGPADHTRRVVVSHPYDAASAQANDWEMLDLSTAGTFSRPNHHFTMGRADVGEVVFTPDGKIGIAVQDDGTLGVFSLDDSGVPAVIAPKFKGGFYADRVVMAARGDHAYVLDDEFREIGGGIYRIDIGCDGSIIDRGLVLAGKLPSALAFAANGDAIVAAVELGASTTSGVHVATWGATPAVVASAAAFPDDMAIVGGATLTRDGAFFLIGDTSQFASVPNRVAVVPVTGEALGTSYVIANVMDPLALIASPFTDDVLVASGFGDALYTLHRDPDGMWRDKGEITYQGAKPQLPGGAVRIEAGALAGTVLVGENLGVRRVELGANGVTDHGLYSLGTGTANIVGAVGVTP